MKISTLTKQVSLVSLFLLSSCINTPVSPLYKQDSSKVDSDKLYEQFKQRNKKEFEDKMKLKKMGNYDIKLSINPSLHNNSSFGIKSNIRSKTWLLGEHSTQKSHENINDKNIFDISKSINDLELTPYEGDIEENGLKKSLTKINGYEQLIFFSETINIELKDQSKLTELTNLYGARQIDFYKGVGRYTIDINKAEISKLENLIREYNKTIPEDIKDIEFSSVSSLKTFIIVLDLYINHKDLYNSVFFDIVMQPNAVQAKFYPNDFEGNTTELQFDTNTKTYNTLPDPEDQANIKNIFIHSYINNTNSPPTYTGHGKSWWLQETFLINTWYYGIGTGINLAHIDTQTFGLLGNKQSGRFDINSRRLLLDKDNKQTAWIIGQDVFSNNENEPLHHGYKSIITCCGERNNDISSVGVSPNSNVVPYIADWAINVARAIDVAADKGANVISFNAAYFANDNPLVQFGYRWVEDSIQKASKTVPVVLGAGNWGFNIHDISPAHLGEMSYEDGIIVVGGVSIGTNNNTNLSLEASFDSNKGIDLKTGINLCGNSANTSNIINCNGKGTNYGVNMVYAPWSGRYISAYKDPTKKEFFEGTSSAEPTVAGLVANMLSRNKALTPGDVERIIIVTSPLGTKVSPHAYMPKNNPIYMINGIESIKQAIKERQSGSKNPADYEVKDKGIGLFHLENSLTDNSTNNKVIGKVTLNDGSIINVLRTASNEEFINANNKVVNLKGWESSITGLSGFEVLNISSVGKPKITEDKLNPIIFENGKPVKISGKNLFSINKIKLEFIDKSKKVYELELNEKPTSNGEELNFIFNKSKVHEKGSTNPIPTGDYSIKFIGYESSEIADASVTGVFKISSANLPINVTTTNNEIVPIVTSDTKTSVVGGDKIAIPLRQDQVNKITSLGFIVRDKFLTYYQMVENYAVLGIDPSIPDDLHSIIMKDLVTGEHVVTFQDALLKTAIALGLKPKDTVRFSDGTTVTADKFIDNNSKIQVKAGDTVGVSLKGDLANITIGLGNKTATLQSIVDNYVAFKIPPDVDLGVQDVIIRYAGGNITFKDALEVLASNPVVAKNNKIAISGNHLDIFDTSIYTISPNGTELSNLNVPYGYSLSWSPDKSKIAYGFADNIGYNIWTMNDDGTSKNQISHGNNDDYPIWSFQGDKIAYINYSRTGSSLCIVNSDGTNQKTLVTYPNYVNNKRTYFDEKQTSWSYDGNKIAYNLSGDIYVIDINTNSISQITNDSNADSPNWSKDNKIIYSDNWDKISKIDPVTLQKHVLYTVPTYINKTVLSLNGTKVAFIAGNIDNDNLESIYTVNPDGTGLIETATHHGYMQDMSWAADGSGILYYLSNRDSNADELWTVNTNGSSKQKLDISFRSPEYIKWSTKSLKSKKSKTEKSKHVSW